MKNSFLFPVFSAAALLAVGVVAPSAAGRANPVILRVELDRPIVLADAPQRALVKVVLDCARLLNTAERPPVNLVVVLDRSGSMSGEKIQRAREAAIEALRRLDHRDLFSLVIFDHEVATLIAPQHPFETAALERQINSIAARGNTALYAGVNQGAAELRKHLDRAGYTHRVILLSDGQANVGPSTTGDLARLGSALGREGIAVTTVGLGDGFNEDLMTALAQQSDGNHYFVAESRELPRIFAAELGDVFRVVARQVVVTIEFPDGIRVLRTIGRSAECHDGRIEFSLNQLYGGQEKFLLVEVELPAARENVVQAVATARLRYADALAGTECEMEAAGSVRYSRDPAAVKRAANQRVQADFAANEVAAAKAQAIALSDAGRSQDAAEVLAQSSAALRSLGADYGNDAVVEEARKAQEEAKRVEAEGIDNLRRKAYRADEYQTRNQQAARN